MIRLYKLQLLTLLACGGYSGLAVCPLNSQARDVEQGIEARHKLRVLTLLIWMFSTFVLAVALVFQAAYQTHARSRKRSQLRMESRRWRAAFWVTTMVFFSRRGHAVGCAVDRQVAGYCKWWRLGIWTDCRCHDLDSAVARVYVWKKQ